LSAKSLARGGAKFGARRKRSCCRETLHNGGARCRVKTLEFLAAKDLVVNFRNAELGLATLNSLIAVLDSETGLPLAIIDGNWVTAKRTAGLSAVAAKRLARNDAVSAAFIGCGVQARNHLEALGGASFGCEKFAPLAAALVIVTLSASWHSRLV
jgi:ornithine cyclodeaminase/alanine dehydrogenase-like protein (mu-crystallin family)